MPEVQRSLTARLALCLSFLLVSPAPVVDAAHLGEDGDPDQDRKAYLHAFEKIAGRLAEPDIALETKALGGLTEETKISAVVAEPPSETAVDSNAPPDAKKVLEAHAESVASEPVGEGDEKTRVQTLADQLSKVLTEHAKVAAEIDAQTHGDKEVADKAKAAMWKKDINKALGSEADPNIITQATKIAANRTGVSPEDVVEMAKALDAGVEDTPAADAVAAVAPNVAGGSGSGSADLASSDPGDLPPAEDDLEVPAGSGSAALTTSAAPAAAAIAPSAPGGSGSGSAPGTTGSGSGSGSAARGTNGSGSGSGSAAPGTTGSGSGSGSAAPGTTGSGSGSGSPLDDESLWDDDITTTHLPISNAKSDPPVEVGNKNAKDKAVAGIDAKNKKLVVDKKKATKEDLKGIYNDNVAKKAKAGIKDEADQSKEQMKKSKDIDDATESKLEEHKKNAKKDISDIYRQAEQDKKAIETKVDDVTKSTAGTKSTVALKADVLGAIKGSAKESAKKKSASFSEALAMIGVAA